MEKRIDEEINKLINECLISTRSLVLKHKEQIEMYQ